MNTKNKFISFIIIICTTILLIGGYTYKDENVNTVEAVEVADKYNNVWTTKDIDIKLEPDINSKNVGVYYWNTRVLVAYINDNWARIKGTEHYLDREYLSESEPYFADYDVPSNNTIKSYMDYQFITLESSDQYKLQESLAYTGDNGLRMVNGRYCIAVGSYYTTTIGQYIDIELENGVVIEAILADCKADIHTDETNRINPNGSVIEFVVETEKLDRMAKIMGDISYVNDWDSKVANIRVYDYVEDFK